MSSSEKITRRAFAALAAAAAGASALPAAAHASSRAVHRRLIKPPRLRFGDTIALVAPGGHTDDEAIRRAVHKIGQLGFRVREGAHLRAVHGNYAGSVQQRCDDLHAMFRDPDVKAIWCIRGGSGCISLLSSLNYRLIRAHPKILIGYSDITALHLAIHRHAALVTFHGPVAGSGPSDYTNTHMLAVLMEPQPTYTIPMALENAVRALAGTPYAADFRGALLFLEEVNEAPYRIDRWMTQLDLAVGLRRAAAVMVGICENCVPNDGETSLTLAETLDIHLKALVVPAVSGYSFGHIRHQFTLPMGIMARLDTLRQTVTLLEPAVT
ncbi:S66 peptidase family protein [Massilia sp. TWP1-3-3]|uniref:S66 peptidase family protein n=1 Tax=Massilia sp. TWP1-3-3 TaxID=2804573 RepID=UPI003CF02D61